jgi:hypothetical protein
VAKVTCLVLLLQADLSAGGMVTDQDADWRAGLHKRPECHPLPTSAFVQFWKCQALPSNDRCAI